MKKIYILTAVFALLTLSLNAQNLATKKVVQTQRTTPTGKVNAPNRATITGSVIAADGTSTSTGYQWLPVYGYYFESAQTNQMIYTATQLDGLQPGDKITSLSFYPNGNIAFSGGSITLSLGNTSISQFSSNSALSVSMTQVARVTSYSVNNGAWTITFTTPFTYTGENILVQVATTSGNYGRTYFYGQDQSNYQSRNSYGSTNRFYFLPKIKLDYERNDDPAISANPTSVSLSNIPGGTSTQTVTVTGLNLTTGITATISGDDAGLFSVNPASLGTNGGSLTVTYSPTAVGTHTATLTLSSTGAQDVTIALSGICTQEMTICDGTNTNSNLPVYGLYVDNYQINQMIYPEITSLVGKKLTSMTFYANNEIGAKLASGTWTIKLGTTTATDFGTSTTIGDITSIAPADIQAVVTGYHFTTGANTLTIEFDTPFEYNGGNLLIEFNETAYTSDWVSVTFYGVNQSNVTGFYSNATSTSTTNGHLSSGAGQRFLPKVTFTYEETGPKIVVSPETLTINDSGTNNTFTVQGSNLGTDNVGVTVPQGSEFLTTTTDQYWGFVNNNGSVSGTATVTYNGHDLSATETVSVGNNLISTTVSVNYRADLYIVGNFGNGWDFSTGTSMTYNSEDNTYTATVTVDAGNLILFARKLGESNPWGTRLVFGPSSDGDWWLNGYEGGDNLDLYDDDPIYFVNAGTYNVTINATDNTFTIGKFVLPPPENVAATVDSDNQSATVTWNAPDITSTSETVDWDFEEQADFNAFTIYDADGDGYNWSYFNDENAVAHSGTGVATSESYRNTSSTSGTALDPDNWLISPEITLGGNLSFWAGGQDPDWAAENFAVYVCVGPYSSTSDFVKIADYTATATMTEYPIDLSQYEGQGYFAIRHYNMTGNDMFRLNIDDISYSTREDAIFPVSYNVYLDGVLVGSVDASDPLTYTFNNVAPGDHTVEISAVYPGNIESELVPADFTIVPKTDAPVISVATGETAYTITATAADPNATVTLTVDGVEYTGTGSVSVSVDRGNTDQSVYVSATAQEQGKLVSDPNTQYVNVPALPATPTPTITYEQTNAYVVITADGEGTITLSAGGQTVTGEGPISITIMRSLEDQTVPATATAVEPNHQPSEPAYASVPVPALAGDPSVAQEGLLRMHLLVVDQFKEEIPDDNSHPDRYGYVLKWEQPANVEDHKQSGTVEVDIHKTEAQVNGYYTLSQVENDTDHDNSELIMDVLTADVGMFLPGENPDVLYYQMQSKKDANPALGEDYITQLQYMKNAQKYEEMLATSPNKTHQYPANETYHYYDDSAPLTGDYGVNFMTYAPSVSTWGIQRRYFEEDGLDNTYGAPIWKTSVGQVRMINTEAQLQRGPQGSTQWDGVGGPCSLVFLGLEAFGDLPSIDVSNILYEPYMFRVWIQSPGNNLRGCSLIPEDTTRVDRPGEHWDGDGTCYGAEPILIYQETTTDGHLYLDVQAPPGDNQPWNSRIQFGALDAGVSDLIVYVRFYYRSTGNGISNNNSKYMLRANRDGDEGETPEVPGYYATEDNDNPDVTTGIVDAWNYLNHGEVVSTTYVNVQGMQSDQPFDGVNIVVTRYSDGTTRTTKVVR